jgi:hypothetical protein
MVADLHHFLFSLLCLQNAKTQMDNKVDSSSFRFIGFLRRKRKKISTEEGQQYDT